MSQRLIAALPALPALAPHHIEFPYGGIEIRHPRDACPQQNSAFALHGRCYSLDQLEMLMALCQFRINTEGMEA
ncbi:MAG TPA: hypothetical protein VNZ53_04895 [Steroidobacteraceae bacterium]|jgi:hypothetical protein|nr:hypothetical protein [Steroidobacteraceae bacterium]